MSTTNPILKGFSKYGIKRTSLLTEFFANRINKKLAGNEGSFLNS